MKRYNWHYVVFHSPDAVVRTSYTSREMLRRRHAPCDRAFGKKVSST